MTLSGRDRAPSDAEEGFTLIEMVVAMTLMATVLLTMAYALFGAMSGLVASRQRSAFVEIANGEMENLRALAYEAVGVASTDTAATYDPGPKFEGRDAVVVASGAPPAVSVVTESPVKGISLPYTVRRWVTWTDTFGGTAHQFKRLNVEVEWLENERSTRRLMLTSVLYPGGGQGLASNNQAPIADMAPPSPVSGTPDTVFSFDGTASYDPDVGDSISTWSWNFGDGLTGTGKTASHVYAAPGCYTVTLTVVDSRGKPSSPASRKVVVGPVANSAPTASFTFGPASGTAPLTATFTSTSTDTDAGGCIASWDWDWGDGTAHGTSEQATHVFESAGTFTVRLTVTDGGGLTASTTATIQVNPLNCDVTGGSFRNPSNNSRVNDITVKKGNNRPRSTSFSFTATSNAACSSVTARLPYNGGTAVVALTLASDVGGVRTWTGTATIDQQFNVGTSQNATMTGSYGTTTDVFTYPFNVHT